MSEPRRRRELLPSPADVIASSSPAGEPLHSPPCGWPDSLKSCRPLKAFLGRTLKGKRVRLVATPAPSDVLQQASSAGVELRDDPFGNSLAVSEALGWETVRGFAIFEAAPADDTAADGRRFVAHRRWWNEKPSGTWVDLTPRPDAFCQVVLVESPLADMPEVAHAPAAAPTREPLDGAMARVALDGEDGGAEGDVGGGGGYADLCAAPELPELPAGEDPLELIPPPRGVANAGTSHMQRLGIVGSSRPPRPPLVSDIATGEPLEHEVESARQARVFSGCHKLMVFHTSRLLSDARWCDAWEASATHVATGGGRRRVCVLGLGSAVPALAAARAGADVVWIERVKRFAECAERLVRANGLSERVAVLACDDWSRAPPLAMRALPSTAAAGCLFDAVLTEEVDDGLLGEGVIALGRLARSRLLTPAGVFGPCRARLYGALVSVRTTDVAGFDLRGFNAFASGRALVSDLEEVEAKEVGVATRLSEPRLLTTIGLEPGATHAAIGERAAASAAELAAELAGAPASAQASASAIEDLEVQIEVTRRGVFNCVAVWSEIELPGGGVINLGPPLPADAATSSRAAVERGAPRPYTMRARGQKLHFCGYERAVRPGESVAVRMRRDDLGVEITASAAGVEGVERWPLRNSLGYHFPMIADSTRNGCFERAIAAALAACSHDERAHVLDIGSGSGLLAMMAARAGARRVTSLDMVPAMAAVARHIVAANGMDGVISVLNKKSTDLSADEMGGRASTLVCELVDNELLGEGTLTSIADARRRLLTQGARIVPRGGALYALPVSMRVPSRAGLDLAELGLFYADAAFREGSYSNDGRKAQLLERGAEWEPLGPPIELFDFDWQSSPIETLTASRIAEVGFTAAASGTLNAFLLYFRLHCDASASNVLSTGPDDVPDPPSGPPTHWDQSIRYLACGVELRAGDAVDVVARHTDVSVQLAVRNVDPSALAAVGHADAVRSGYRLAVSAATTGASVHLRPPQPRGGGRPAASARAAKRAAKAPPRALTRADGLPELQPTLVALEALARRVAYRGAVALMVVGGWVTPESSGLRAEEAQLLTAFHHAVSGFEAAQLHAALRLQLAPRGQYTDLLSAESKARWALAKELYVAKLFHDDERIRRDVLLLLRDKLMLYSREEWADAFGMPFWETFAEHARFGARAHPCASLLERVERAGGSVSSLTLEELITLAKPSMAEGWASPFAWFVSSTTHAAEALTTESVQALAAYLEARRAALAEAGAEGGGAADVPIIEVGAGSGRLCHHLNATGLLNAEVVGSDVQPQPTPSHPDGAFPLRRLDDAEAIRLAARSSRTRTPPIVLCAWMGAGVDWTARWRELGVAEYVLIGELGHDGAPGMPPPPDCAPPHAVSPAVEHPGYERFVLDDVSRHLLHISDARPGGASEGCGTCCAVSYRRRIGVAADVGPV